MFQCLVDIIDTAHKNDAQLFVHIRVAMFSSISVLLQHARTEHSSGECPMSVSEELRTHPSPNPTIASYVALGEGWVRSWSDTDIDPFAL